MRTPRGLAVALLVVAAALVPGVARGDPAPTLVAAGDIACPPSGPVTATSCQQAATADLIGRLAPTVVTPLGDNQYDSGALDDYLGSFAPTWGRFMPLMHPVPGNEDYATPGAAGYFDYFGAAAGSPTRGYYSYDLGSWHLVALNSNCASVGGCGPGSPQEAWLRADLAAHPSACTLAYWHHPLFTSGSIISPATDVRPLWADLLAQGADVVLNGHSHVYERFAPQDSAGDASPGGIRELVVGTGGDSHHSIGQVQPNSEIRDAQSFGVLQLTLGSAGYDWSFISTAGTVLDSGADACHAPAATTGPATPAADGGEALTGTLERHGRAVVYRFDYGTTDAYGSSTAASALPAGATSAAAGTVPGPLLPGTTYHYRLVAVSDAGRTASGGDMTFTTAPPPEPSPPPPAQRGPAATPPPPPAHHAVPRHRRARPHARRHAVSCRTAARKHRARGSAPHGRVRHATSCRRRHPPHPRVRRVAYGGRW